MDQQKYELRDRCRVFAGKVIAVCDGFGSRVGARDVAGQVIRSAASIGANVAEARGAGSTVEFTRFFRISLKSANETIYWLELIQDAGFAPKETLSPLLDEATQLARMMGAAVTKLKVKSKAPV